MNNEEFTKFIEFKDCTYIEFKKAEDYFKNANYSEKRDFLSTCFKIVKQVITSMINNKSTELSAGKEIYEKHGLSDTDITYYFNLYKNRYMSEQEKINFLQFQTDFLAEKIWLEAKKGLWNQDEIRGIANAYNISIKKTNKLIYYYFKNVLNMSDDDIAEYKKLYKKYRLFIELKLTNEYEFNFAYNFYNNYANNQEKEEFKNVSLQILEKFQGNTPTNYNAYLKSINLNMCNIYFLASIFKPDLASIILKSFKPYYDFCSSNFWIAASIKKEAQKQNISYEVFKRLAILYGTKVIGIENIDGVIRNARTKRMRSNFDKAPILEQILKSTNEEEYFALFKNNNIHKKDINRFCYSYHRELPKEQKETMETNLIAKYNIFSKATKYVPSNIKYTEDILREFANSSLSSEEFCQIKGYNINGFNCAIRNCKNKTLDLQLKNKIDTETTARITKKDAETETVTLNILECIKNGITINDTIYPFDFISFFVLFPNIYYKNIKTGFLPKNESVIIRSYFLPLSNMKPISKNIINARICKQINNGENVYIKEFSKDELTEIVEFMTQYNIPLTDRLFDLACVRYATIGLDIYNQDTFSLK